MGGDPTPEVNIMSKMVTRLYVYGKNNVSIENFPTDKYHTFGQKYIEC